VSLYRSVPLSCLMSLMPAALSGCGSSPATADNRPTENSSNPVAVSPAVTARLDDAKPDEPSTTDKAAAEPATPTANRVVDKTFDDIKFDIQPDEPFRREMIGEEIEKLAGQRVRLRGYILPTPQKRGIKQFVLVRDNQECCFGPGAAIYDCVLVEMRPGKTAEFSIRPVTVEGTFDINVFMGPDDAPLAIYHIDGESVE
jgi:hypothetical protein